VSSAPDLTSRILRHERAVVATGIALLVALSWWFLATGAPGMEMSGSSGAAVPPPFVAVALMWWLMMFAMMLPSAAPAILLYGHVRRMRGADAEIAQSWIFLAGYLTVWLLFSLAAASAQLLLTGSSMSLESRLAQGSLLVAAGLYQLSPFKLLCLHQCRAPAQFISRHWRPGTLGTIRLGILHGAYCVGCCWLLMALLFVGGVMNFAWIAALALIVGIEKLTPKGELIGRIAGIALIALGIWVIAGR